MNVPKLSKLSILGVSLLLAQFAFSDPWQHPDNNSFIDIFDFPATSGAVEKSKLVSAIGRGYYNRLRDFYTDPDDTINFANIYEDFKIDPYMVMSCEKRHKQQRDFPLNTELKKQALNYFCEPGDWQTEGNETEELANCNAFQKEKIYLDYCLDLDDTLDWVALQGAFLNWESPSAGFPDRKVYIPANREFYVNQSLVLPEGIQVIWLGTGNPPYEWDGKVWTRPNASFIKFVPQDEPINFDQPRQTGFSLGTVFIIGETNSYPFGSGIRYSLIPYSGYANNLREANRLMDTDQPPTKPYNAGIIKNIDLRYPHIDANSVLGENGISFTSGVGGDFVGSTGPLKVYGGIIKNVKINTYRLTDESGAPTTTGVIAADGGKAIQCEAGCRGLDIRGITIIDSDIGINSNAIKSYEEIHNLFGPGLTSQVRVSGIRMKNVDIPVNVYNDINVTTNIGAPIAQVVEVDNFGFENSGRGFLAGRGNLPTHPQKQCISTDTQATYSGQIYPSPYGGAVTSLNGTNVVLSNGYLNNSDNYLGIKAIVTGYSYHGNGWPTLQNVTYKSYIVQ